jgi:hypothetical protein
MKIRFNTDSQTVTLTEPVTNKVTEIYSWCGAMAIKWLTEKEKEVIRKYFVNLSEF